ncbi:MULTISPECIES: hypothetical protein [Cupriavidus]
MKRNFAMTLGVAAVAASLMSHAVHAHTVAWYSDHIEEAKKRDMQCQAKQKSDISPGVEDQTDCDNAVVALVTQPSKRPIPKAISAPAPKWKNFGH